MWPGSSSRRSSTAPRTGSGQLSASSSLHSQSGPTQRTGLAGAPLRSWPSGSGYLKKVCGSLFASSPRTVSTRACRSHFRAMEVRCSRIGGGRRRSDCHISPLLSDHRMVGLHAHHYALSEAVDNSHPQLWITRWNRTKKVGLWSGKVGLQYREGGTTVPPSPSEPRNNQSFRARARINLCTNRTDGSAATGVPYPTCPSSRTRQARHTGGWIAVVPKRTTNQEPTLAKPKGAA